MDQNKNATSGEPRKYNAKIPTDSIESTSVKIHA